MAPPRRPHRSRPGRQPARHAHVLVCRGCCCGRPQKHPGFDHDDQLARLRTAGGPHAVVRAVGCLGPCSDSNVVAVRLPGSSRRLWFGGLLDEEVTEALADWIAAGCREEDLPDRLRGHLLGDHGAPVELRR